MIRRGLIVFVGILILWQLFVWALSLPQYLLPGPIVVIETLWQSKLLLVQQAWPTILETLIGLTLGALWGAIMAISMSLFRPVRFWMMPVLLVSQAIPTFAIAPLFVIWLGYGISSKVAVTVVALFFPVTVACFDGLRNTDQGWLDLARVMSGGRWHTMRYIRLPAAMPSFASGLRVATAWAPMAAVVGEWVGSSKGLGFLMLNANARVDTPLMFAALFVLVAFSLTLYFMVDRLLVVLIPWAKS